MPLFQAIKLDIDNIPVEMQFIEAIASDPQLRASISEMMFEMHYDSVHMAPWFGDIGKGTSWVQVLELLRALRDAGLRIHYWP